MGECRYEGCSLGPLLSSCVDWAGARPWRRAPRATVQVLTNRLTPQEPGAALLGVRGTEYGQPPDHT